MPRQAPLFIPEPTQCLAKMGAGKEGVWGEGVTGSEKRIGRNQGLGAKDSERGGGEDRETRAHLDFVGKVRVRGRDLNEVHVAGEQMRRPASSSQDMCVIDA